MQGRKLKPDSVLILYQHETLQYHAGDRHSNIPNAERASVIIDCIESVVEYPPVCGK